MQFFKHYTKMSYDVKIRRTIKKYGLKGYGLYNSILEKIALQLSTDNPLPDLEDTAEDIAYEYNDDTAQINEMMAFMINQGLFEIDEITGRIMCMKMYRYIDKSQTRSEEIREMIEKYKSVIDSNIPSRTSMKKRKEKKRIRKDKDNKQITDKIKFNEYVFLTKEEYDKLILKFGEDQTKKIIDKLDNYKGSSGREYKSDYRTILLWVVDSVGAKVIKNNTNKLKCPACNYDIPGGAIFLCPGCGLEIDDFKNKKMIEKYKIDFENNNTEVIV